MMHKCNDVITLIYIQNVMQSCLKSIVGVVSSEWPLNKNNLLSLLRPAHIAISSLPGMLYLLFQFFHFFSYVFEKRFP